MSKLDVDINKVSSDGGYWLIDELFANKCFLDRKDERLRRHLDDLKHVSGDGNDTSDDESGSFMQTQGKQLTKIQIELLESRLNESEREKAELRAITDQLSELFVNITGEKETRDFYSLYQRFQSLSVEDKKHVHDSMIAYTRSLRFETRMALGNIIARNKGDSRQIRFD